MNRLTIIAMVFLLILPVISLNTVVSVKAEARSDVDVTFYASDAAAWTALQANEVDFVQWALTKQQKEAAEADPNIQLCKTEENGFFEFDVNNNFTIPSYPTVRSATNDLNVRQAIASLINKSHIISNILNDFGVRVDVPIPPPLHSWCNASLIGGYYPHPYNPEAAAANLTAAGFADTDSDGWLEYPAGWWGMQGMTAEQRETYNFPLVVCVRSDHAHRLAAGQYLINQLEVTLVSTSIGAGFKTTGTQWQQPRSVLALKVMGSGDYQVYTGGWSVGRGPPAYLYSRYHSFNWFPYGPMMLTGVNMLGLPNYPDLDYELEQFITALSIPDMADALFHCKNAQSLIIAKHCVDVELWSYSSFWAYRKELVGVVNMDAYGVENVYTFLNAYKLGGGPTRVAAVAGPARLNILYSDWYFEHLFLDRVYTSGLSFQPYDISVDQPWVIQDWNVSTWWDLQTPIQVQKTVVTYYIRKDVGIISPVTGCFDRFWDADDFEFTIWYNYAFSDSWQYANFMEVKYTNITDVNGDGWNELQVYFDTKDYWLYNKPVYPLLTKDELLEPLCAQKTESWGQTGTNVHMLANSVVQVVNASLGTGPINVPLQEGIDYIVKAGYDLNSHIEFYPLRNLTGTVVMTYWYADIPASGFYLGGLLWQETMCSLGTHYPVSMTTDPPGVGDTISLRRNPAFFLEKPLLGEIDWAWTWGPLPKPRPGFYQITIFDIVRAAAAYCTRGDGKFNPKYFPGADLDPSDLCHIGLFDLVVISGKFAKTFGMPSDSAHGWMIPPPMPPGTPITLPQYNHGIKELSKSQGFQYTFAAGVVTVTMGNPADYLVGEYHTATNMVERFVITIDP